MNSGDLHLSPAAAARRAESDRWTSIAEKLLAASDLVGCKRFAERALDCDPLSPGAADSLLAVADVLLSSHRRINNQPDWYSILSLPSPTAATPASISLHFRRLALLLQKDPSLPFAPAAFKLISDAFSVLSDPHKKSLFDSELQISNQHNKMDSSIGIDSDTGTFWTVCPACCSMHQFPRAHRDGYLRCPSCKKGFKAAELANSPAIVPGTDMYYCSWGFFPMGFPGFENGWEKFCSVAVPAAEQQEERRESDVVTPTPPKKSSGTRKVMAKKRVGGGVKVLGASV